jgi:hypothetical protein
MTRIYGPSKRTKRNHAGEFFEITITRPRAQIIFVRLDEMDGEIVSVPASMRDSLAKIPSGLDDFRILDRVTVTATPEGRHITTGEIHSVVFERPGCGKGIMIKDEHSSLSTWMPLPDSVTVTPAD